MLEPGQAVLVVVDFQGTLARIVHDSEATIDAAGRLVRGAKALGLPVLRTEQAPAKLGPTVPELAGLFDTEAIPKVAFSCCRERRFADELARTGRREVLLCGIETHICVYQTARDLLARGSGVHVVADAVSSRSPENRRIGLEKMARAGAEITSVETVLFELLRTADDPAFRAVQRIVK